MDIHYDKDQTSKFFAFSLKAILIDFIFKPWYIRSRDNNNPIKETI